MEVLGLKFDEMKVDTQLAAEYLKKKGHHFSSIGVCEVDHKTTYDNINNKIHVLCDSYLDVVEKYKSDLHASEENDNLNINDKLRHLAKKIDENSMLFSQLEALIRKAQQHDVQNCDIKLIVQNLLHCSLSLQCESPHETNWLSIADHTPLLTLGYVAQILSSCIGVVITASVNTAAVCHLFTELCHEVGLKNVDLLIVDYSSPLLLSQLPTRVDLDEIKGLQSGCMGVITACSDVDSAIDNLLASTIKYPWKLRRILIQESVYESVKKTFDWKINLKPHDDVVDSNLKQLCTDVFIYDDKTLLVDYAGNAAYDKLTNAKHVVLVESYRTTKELISLISKYSPFSLSLWCSDISEANEIAFGVNTSIVWMNNFGAFEGPAAASQAFYNIIDMENNHYVNSIYNCDDVNTLIRLRDTWTKLNIHERVDIINNILLKIIPNESLSREDIEFANTLKESLCAFGIKTSDNFVDVGNNRLCIGVHKALDYVMVRNCKIKCQISAIIALVNGQGLLVRHSCRSKKIYKLFMDEGLPIVVTNDIKNTGNFQIANKHSFSQTKVVCQHFGTIFAN